jgi:hypothetical protein
MGANPMRMTDVVISAGEWRRALDQSTGEESCAQVQRLDSPINEKQSLLTFSF